MPVVLIGLYNLVHVTLQIRQYRRLEDGSLNVLTRGQQRFHLKHHWIDVEGMVIANLCYSIIPSSFGSSIIDG